MTTIAFQKACYQLAADITYLNREKQTHSRGNWKKASLALKIQAFENLASSAVEKPTEKDYKTIRDELYELAARVTDANQRYREFFATSVGIGGYSIEYVWDRFHEARIVHPSLEYPKGLIPKLKQETARGEFWQTFQEFAYVQRRLYLASRTSRIPTHQE